MEDISSLPIPPEPAHIRKQILERYSRLRVSSMEDKALAIWFGSPIPSYLWSKSEWGRMLRPYGLTWQMFLEICSLHTQDMIKWVEGNITWDELIKKVKASIRNYVRRRI